jgi:hypothetical protein
MCFVINKSDGAKCVDKIKIYVQCIPTGWPCVPHADIECEPSETSYPKEQIKEAAMRLWGAAHLKALGLDLNEFDILVLDSSDENKFSWHFITRKVRSDQTAVTSCD